MRANIKTRKIGIFAQGNKKYHCASKAPNNLFYLGKYQKITYMFYSTFIFVDNLSNVGMQTFICSRMYVCYARTFAQTKNKDLFSLLQVHQGQF